MTEWLHINKIEMLVVKAEYIYELSKSVEEINISCQLLNIARGRCEVKISKCFKNNFEKKLFISSKKAIMKAEIELNEKNFNNLNSNFFKYRNQSSKKIKVSLLMENAVATSSSGILNLENDLSTDLKDILFNIPVF